MADEDVIEAVVKAADEDGHAFDSAVIEQAPLHPKPVRHLSDRALQHRLVGSAHHHVRQVEAYPLEIDPLLQTHVPPCAVSMCMLSVFLHCIRLCKVQSARSSVLFTGTP